MKIAHPPILLFLIVLTSSGLFAQYDQCQSLLREYYQNMNITVVPEKGTAYYMSANMAFYPGKESAGQAVQSDYALYMDDHQNHYLSKEVDYFQDEHDRYIVIHNEKKIYHTKNVEDASQKRKWQIIYTYRDSLINEATVSNCYTQNKIQYVTVSLPHFRQRQSKIATMEFILDLEKEQITKITLNYLPDYKFRKAETIYKVMDFNHKPFSKSTARKHVVNAQGKLLEKYKSYTLVEQS